MLFKVKIKEGMLCNSLPSYPRKRRRAGGGGGGGGGGGRSGGGATAAADGEEGRVEQDPFEAKTESEKMRAKTGGRRGRRGRGRGRGGGWLDPWTVSTICWALVGLMGESGVFSQLVINIKNKGGEVFQEKIVSNITEDVIELEYINTDGSVITQLVDFKHEAQIFRIIMLGEEERGDEKQYQSLCFVTSLNKNEFISSDAMSKLRQRNPGTIRQPEEEKGKEVYEMDLRVELGKSAIITPHLAKLCESGLPSTNNSSLTFAREIDLKAWANSKVLNRDIISLTSSVHKLGPTSPLAPKPIPCNVLSASIATASGNQSQKRNSLPSQSSSPSSSSSLWSSSLWKPCQCQLQVCIPWYPCTLKFCRGKDSSTGKVINYRCGIRTCRKCRLFHFNVRRKQNCLWDE